MVMNYFTCKNFSANVFHGGLLLIIVNKSTDLFPRFVMNHKPRTSPPRATNKPGTVGILYFTEAVASLALSSELMKYISFS